MNYDNESVNLRELQVRKELKFDENNVYPDPTKIPRIIKVSGFHQNFACLDINGYCYTFGTKYFISYKKNSNEYNVLGLKGIAQPKHVDKARFLNIGQSNFCCDLACGDGFMILITHIVSPKQNSAEAVTGRQIPELFLPYETFKNLYLKILHAKLDRIGLQQGKISNYRSAFEKKIANDPENLQSFWTFEELMTEKNITDRETSHMLSKKGARVSLFSQKQDSEKELKLIPRFVMFLAKSGMRWDNVSKTVVPIEKNDSISMNYNKDSKKSLYAKH